MTPPTGYIRATGSLSARFVLVHLSTGGVSAFGAKDAREDTDKHCSSCGETGADDGDLAFNDRPAIEGLHFVCLNQHLRCSSGEVVDSQVGFAVELLSENTTTRTIPMIVKLHHLVSKRSTSGRDSPTLILMQTSLRRRPSFAEKD